MTVYAIATLNIHDREGYSPYEDGFMEVFNQYSGQILSVDEAPTTLEGEWGFTRTVLLSFPDKAALDSWYNSDAYQKLLSHRLAASNGNVVVIAGLPGN